MNSTIQVNKSLYLTCKSVCHATHTYVRYRTRESTVATLATNTYIRYRTRERFHVKNLDGYLTDFP